MKAARGKVVRPAARGTERDIRPTEIAKARDDVHLGEDVYVRHLELKHGAEGEEDDGDIFGGIGEVGRVGEVDGGELGVHVRL